MNIAFSLEELLSLFDAEIEAISPDGNFTIMSNEVLPDSPDAPYHKVEVTNPVVLADGYLKYGDIKTFRYYYNKEVKESLRILLFLTSERKRYIEFCKQVDTDLQSELNTSDK